MRSNIVRQILDSDERFSLETLCAFWCEMGLFDKAWPLLLVLEKNGFKQRETEEEKAARKQAIADGTLEATKVPFRVMEMASEGLALAEKLQGHYNNNCDSDFGVGVLNFMACMRGAWLNVKINLPGVNDEALAAEYKEKGEKMLADGEVTARRIYGEIEEAL